MHKLEEKSLNIKKLDENLSEPLNISEKAVNSASQCYTTPLIFNKKKNKTVYKPLHHVINDIGTTRHYPPAAQE